MAKVVTCTFTAFEVPKDYTAIAQTITRDLISLSRIQENITVKLFTQFLFGSISNVMKSLGLDRINGYGSVKINSRQKNGRKTCQRLIYELSTLGIIMETPTGTEYRPEITITIGENHDYVL